MANKNLLTYFLTICLLVLSPHVLIALEFDGNHFCILISKIVNPCYNEIIPKI